MSATSLPKNIALSPFGYWPRTKWQRFCEFIQYRFLRITLANRND